VTTKWATLAGVVAHFLSIGCVGRPAKERCPDGESAPADSAAAPSPDAAPCEPDYLCVGEDRSIPDEEAQREKRLQKLDCIMWDCNSRAPGSLCISIECRPKGTRTLFRDSYGGLHSDLARLREDRNLRIQFLTHQDLLHDAMMCMVRMRPTNDNVNRLVWFDIQLNTDGHLSLRSARRLDHIPGEEIDWASRGKPNRRLGLCLEKALAGKTIYNPRYVDAVSPRTEFPSVVLNFHGSIAMNPLETYEQWKKRTRRR
jgi:hypothetical protein